LIDIQKQLNDEILEMRKLGKEDRKQKITEINKSINTYQSNISQQKNTIATAETPNDTELKIGDRVWMTQFESSATITDISRDIYRVDMNGIFFEVKRNDIYKLSETNSEKAVTLTSRKNTEYTNKAKIEINLLGKTFDEALPLIDELIDNAMFCGLSKVRIIHGRGTGVLRQKIRDYLKKNSKVVEFYSPPHEAGGDGVTVVVV
jgi:DNA mismatch repair protein MutS2